ncbi:MAG TPA: hypothetical protein PLT20_14340 [Sedimentisphaerales bacterium]|nr:hypothetical protein [Sedimentisphaerales bacterium]
MTSHTQQYRLAEEADQKRLEELSDRDAESVGDVRGELGLARFLAEKCALTSPALCNAILGNIAKLSIAAERHAVATSELLARPALRAFVAEVVAAVCDELNQLPNGEALIENIAKRIDAAFVKLKNEPKQTPRLLTYDGNHP